MAEQEKAPDAVAKLHEGSNRADDQNFEVRRTLMCWTPLRYLGTAEPLRRGWGAPAAVGDGNVDESHHS